MFSELAIVTLLRYDIMTLFANYESVTEVSLKIYFLSRSCNASLTLISPDESYDKCQKSKKKDNNNVMLQVKKTRKMLLLLFWCYNF